MQHTSNRDDSKMDFSKTLADLKSGQRGRIVRIEGDASFRSQLAALGVVRGTEIRLDRTAPLGDPRTYTLLGYNLTIRNSDARLVYLDGDH